MSTIPLLKAQDIECRVAQAGDTWATLLLYKDARCDMRILDEVFGPMNWRREHKLENRNCVVSIWDREKGQWISKEDTGKESNAEKEKGIASDSFKRACFNWGIGRELYTAPTIFVNLDSNDFNAKRQVKTRFDVSNIAYSEDRRISFLEITDGKRVRFHWGGRPQRAMSWRDKTVKEWERQGRQPIELQHAFHVDKETTEERWQEIFINIAQLGGARL